MKLNKSFAAVAAAALAIPLLLSGCAPSETAIVDDTAATQTEGGVAIRLLQSENFSGSDGVYSLTIPGKSVGQENDVNCVYVKDTVYKGGAGGVSFDWNGVSEVRAPGMAP